MGCFDSQAELFQFYRSTLQFTNMLAGGVPKDPAIVEKWLRHKAGIEKEQEIRNAMIRTLRELYPELEEMDDFDQIIEASRELQSEQSLQGFKQDDNGLYIESRQVKAMIKECTNALYGRQEKWGPTKKGPKSFVAENVFVTPDRIHLDRDGPDSVEMFITHTHRGSSLGLVELVEEPRIEFAVKFTPFAHERLLGKDKGIRWARIATLAQENGLGAMRSQGFGKFEWVEWEEVEEGAEGADRKIAVA